MIPLPESRPVPPPPRTVHIVRRAMYDGIRAFAKEKSLSGEGIAIAEKHGALPAAIPGVRFADLPWPRYDLQTLAGVPDAGVDLVASDMVLEHVEDPQAAWDASFRVLRPGGWAVHTTVFCMPLHPCPIDPWRFSAEGLSRLAARAGFREVRTGAHGNRRTLLAILGKLSRVPVPFTGPSPLSALLAGDDARFATCVWAAARK